MRTALGIGMGLTFQGGQPPFWGLDHDDGDYSTSTAIIAGVTGQTTGSIGAWFKVPADNSQRTMVSFGVTSGSITVLWVQVENKKLDLRVQIDGTTQWTWIQSAAMTPGDWHHVVLAQNATEPVVYLDGTAEAGAFGITTNKTKWFGAVVGAINPVTVAAIGALNQEAVPSIFWGTELTQVGISSSVFTAADAARIMRDPNAVADYDIAYYRMTPGVGQSVIDASANGYHMQRGSTSGTDANDPTWTPDGRGYTTLLSGGPV